MLRTNVRCALRYTGSPRFVDCRGGPNRISLRDHFNLHLWTCQSTVMSTGCPERFQSMRHPHARLQAPEPCLEQPQIFQIFQKLGWRGEGEIP